MRLKLIHRNDVSLCRSKSGKPLLQSLGPRELEAERADKVSIALCGFFRRAHARENILFDNAPAVMLQYLKLLHEG